ncbi:MAG: hypothetical protein AB7P24_12425 [Nitrospira sp.]
MKWEVPSFVEIKMDSEISSYQDDFRDDTDLKDLSNSMRSSEDFANPHGST